MARSPHPLQANTCRQREHHLESPETSTVSESPRREKAVHDKLKTPRWCLQEGHDTGVSPPPDPKIKVSVGAIRACRGAATKPSRRIQRPWTPPPPASTRTGQVMDPGDHTPPTPPLRQPLAQAAMFARPHPSHANAPNQRASHRQGRGSAPRPP